MNTKIYVGNLLYEVTDEELRQLFLPYGDVVSAEVVRYKKSRRSKGFGYVKMGNPDQAQAAMAALNDQDYRGRRLFLQPAKSDDPPAEAMQEHSQSEASLENAGTVVTQEFQEAQESQNSQEMQVAQQAQQEYNQQQEYSQEQPQSEPIQELQSEPVVESVPDHIDETYVQPSQVNVQPEADQPSQEQPQNLTPHEGLSKSGTIFSNGGRSSNN